jgi:translocator protein
MVAWVGAVVWAGVTLSLGALATDLGPWYRGLRKPTWQPPDWLFAPAWSLIFALAAGAAAVAWDASTGAPDTRAALVIAYACNGVLNTMWSVLFFTLRRPEWALAEVPLLWLSVVAMMLTVRAAVPWAAFLLLPYLLWVSFASVLNFSITRLNG